MKVRNILVATMLTMFLFATESKAQTSSTAPLLKPAAFAPEVKSPDFKAEPTAPVSAVRFRKKQFLILSAVVYGASLADMHATLQERKYSWWYETDPLARPFVKLPPPAYYATGLLMATGLNWISWKMGHSRKWHWLAAIPQLLAIGGNTYGFKSNRFN
jgi:hypothetical protein